MVLADLALYAAAGYSFLIIFEQVTPVNIPRWLMAPLLFALAYVSHLIPMPWLIYVAASGVIPVLYMLGGGSSGESYLKPLLNQVRYQRTAEKINKSVRSAQRKPRSKVGSRVPKL